MQYSMRYFSALIIGFIIAGCLFLIMRGFISGGSTVTQTARSVQLAKFVSTPHIEKVQRKQHRIPKKPKPQKVPTTQPKVTVSHKQNVQRTLVKFNVPNIGVPSIGGNGLYLQGGGYNVSNLSANGQAIPIVPVQPQYPAKALFGNIEGYVTLEFTIQPDGSATDPQVIDSKPRRVFDKAAINALLRSKFKPKVVNGKPVASRATFKYTFQLPKNRR